MTAAPDRYLAEILGQPAALTRAAAALERQAVALEGLATLAPPARGRPLVLAGMGSSFDACLAAAAVLGRDGILATPIEAAELLHVRLPALAGAGLLVVVSQSGASAEVVRLVEAARGLPRRPPVVAVTNGAGSPLAARADIALDTAVGPEACPSTMTFAGSLVVLAAIARVLGGGATGAAIGEVRADAAAAAAAAEALLAAPDATADRLAAWLDGRPTIVALGRGVGLAAAEMAVLTLQEAAGLPATALPTAEFRHGPLEVVGPGVAVLLFALEPATEALDRSFAAELAAAGAAVLLVGPANQVPPGVEALGLSGPRGMLAPAVALIPVQLLARRLARARGRHPCELTRASKVTTRE